jgi:hypothetical protein
MSLTDLGAVILRQMDPETAHRLAIRALQVTPLPAPGADDPILKTLIAGLEMSNPVGLAAGLDKNGEVLDGLSRLGFGAVECGSVTPRAQAGNPKPRLFRLSEDRAIINRMGFNNAGLEPFAARLAHRPKRTAIGANLGANKDTEDKAADYVAGLRRLAGLADYFTINISSPNTPGLRALQGREALDDLLGRINEARPADGAPVFLKIAPDLIGEEIGLIVEASLAHQSAGAARHAEIRLCGRGGRPVGRAAEALCPEGAGSRRRGRRRPSAPDRGGRHSERRGRLRAYPSGRLRGAGLFGPHLRRTRPDRPDQARPGRPPARRRLHRYFRSGRRPPLTEH